jgi:DNA-binding CsgD family transcriptional regulator
MKQFVICVVADSTEQRQRLTCVLCPHYQKVLSFSDIDLNFYKKHLMGFENLCLIVSSQFINDWFADVVRANHHHLIQLADDFTGNYRETEAIILRADSTDVEILETLSNVSEEDKRVVISSALSERETEVLRHVALGLSNKEIADKLFISPHTVITHRKNITARLGIKSISGLTVYAILKNIISMDDADV